MNKHFSFIVVIPARYKSSRFPGKPLVDICGKSLVSRVWEKCCQAVGENLVYVATDDSQIFEHCQKNQMQVIMTSDSCLTGTDRLFEVSTKIDADLYINVQGDEPLINPEDIKTIINYAVDKPDQIANGMCEITSEEDFRSCSVPKVVFRPDGRLLYMSRGAIPTSKQLEFVKAHKQVCIYAFPKKALEAFASVSKKTALEQIEDIEILRFLELGFDVQMIKVSESSVAVDFPEDVPKVEKIIKEMHEI